MAQGFTRGIPIDTDGTLSADSDFLIPSQKAIKTYVDTEISGTTLFREVSIADATSITLNADTTDIGVQLNTQAVGALTVNAPTGTPTAWQTIFLTIKSTNIQTFTWNAIFIGSVDLPLPTDSSGGALTDVMAFRYYNSKWLLVAKNFGYTI